MKTIRRAGWGACLYMQGESMYVEKVHRWEGLVFCRGIKSKMSCFYMPKERPQTPEIKMHTTSFGLHESWTGFEGL